jgi:flagellar capping protein FliD
MSSQEIATWVRNWVHFDNLASVLSKQATNARKEREAYEQQIISALRRNHMENAVIKVTGGQITMAHEKTSAGLTLGRIEEIAQKYFTLRGGTDETEAFMRFLRKNRGTEESVRLKKTTIVPPLAPVPSITG